MVQARRGVAHARRVGHRAPGRRSARTSRERFAIAAEVTAEEEASARPRARAAARRDPRPRRRRRARSCRPPPDPRRRAPHAGDARRRPRRDAAHDRPGRRSAACPRCRVAARCACPSARSALAPVGVCLVGRPRQRPVRLRAASRAASRPIWRRPHDRRPGPINPPPRLLMGPGPINADPRVLRAMSAPLVGQYDPVMTGVHDRDAGAVPRGVRDRATRRPCWSTARRARGSRRRWSRSSRPGDRVLVPGVRPVRAPARRDRASARRPRCTRSRCRGGRCSPPSAIEEAIVAGASRTLLAHRAGRHVDDDAPAARRARRDLREARRAVLHATPPRRSAATRSRWTRGAWTPRPPACRSAWAARRAARPITLSERAVEVIRAPQHDRGRHPRGVRRGRRRARSRSNYFDLGMILDYWGPRRLNHHTEATIDALRRPRVRARALLEEGRRGRHRPAPRCTARAMLAGVRGLGLAGVRRRRAQDEQRGRRRDPRGRATATRRAPRCSTTSASRSARRSARCTAGSGASAPWATTRARTPCCVTLAALEQVLRRGRRAACRAGGGVDAALRASWAA